MDKIKKNMKRILGNINKIGLKNKCFTIISNNCWGGFVYQKFNLQYRTPFVGLFIFAPQSGLHTEYKVPSSVGTGINPISSEFSAKLCT